MSKRKYIPTTCVSETIYERFSRRDNKDVKSVSIHVVYVWNRPHAVDAIFCDCSEACKEYYGDWDIERYIHIRGEALQKLVCKFTVRDANTLLRRMADMFRPYGWSASRKMEDWLERKGIEYTTSIY